MKKVLLIILSFSLFNSHLLAQEARIEVDGVVTDPSGMPLPGVNVIEKGTSNGVVTDFDGEFSIDVLPGAVLIFSYLSYETAEREVDGQTQFNITLEPSASALEEVVVVGYGTQKRTKITSAVSSVDDDYLEQQPTANVTQALQGSAAGVTTVASVTPGGDAEIRIRGMGTINNNDPLWVIDGVFGAPPPPPNQIKSIEILKDAASTAIYGARGANGVILVTTKTGKKNQPAQVEVSLRTGFNAPSAKYEFMTDPQLLGQMLWLEYTNDGLPTTNPHYGSGSEPILSDYLFPNGASIGDPNVDPSLYNQQTYPITRSNSIGTDWLEEIYHNGIIQDYSFSVNGGSDQTTYSFQGSYLDEEGILKNTSFQRASLRANIDSQLNNWLTIGERLGVTVSQGNGWRGNNSHENLFNQIYKLNPILPVYDIAGNYAGGIVGGLGFDGPNPVGFLDRSSSNRNRTYDITSNIYAQISLIEGLSFKTLFGYNARLHDSYNPSFPAWENINGARGTTLGERRSTNTTWNWTNTLNYQKTFAEDHDIDLLVGIEAIESDFSFISASRQEYFSTDPDFLVLDAGASNQLNNGNGSEWSLFSYFTRLQYSFIDRYLFNFTLRRDGSSRFGENHRYGVFPAASLGWIVSQENFLTDSNWLNYLKIRGSWGESGNDQIGNYNSFSTFTSSLGNSYYAIGGSDNSITQGYQSASIGNPNAKWETTVSTNIAFDATLFQGLDLSVDLWQKNTEDMLFPVAIPLVSGSASPPSVNIGSMTNKGIDISLGFKDNLFNGELQYNLSGTFTAYKNEVTKLSNNENEFIQGFPVRQQVYTRTEVGRAFPEYYGYIVDGIFQTQEEAEAHPTNGTYNEPGNLKIRDVNEDGVISPEDRTYIGSPHPDFTTGLRMGLQFKNFDFAATFYASVGNDIANYTNRFIRYGAFSGPNSPDRLFRSWGSPYLQNNNDAIFPKASSSTSFEQNASTEYIEDGSYLRLQNLQLGYNIPTNLISSFNINELRIYALAANLFTITNYSGLDPEISAKRDGGVAQEIDRGVDVGTWPVSKQFMFGLNISF
ncbi:TonB-linked outer membrane protein, SusC/RagA family [Salegentibacter agarivorans]|uniref:TonB-linked outer membrane protein, SusC/RagA family n=1 Tax=Salegentibacter agarivorans TaxID=345907 RepID=A0A1I2KP87_9FLAO|nr:TonB-dependent receptor [Salegentibacter agarivorans]SFF68333.1 TonB-linked outer membrane protein, SusC/RagA family [Salegentibacter agarivorans]